MLQNLGQWWHIRVMFSVLQIRVTWLIARDAVLPQVRGIRGSLLAASICWREVAVVLKGEVEPLVWEWTSRFNGLQAVTLYDHWVDQHGDRLYNSVVRKTVSDPLLQKWRSTETISGLAE